ncbi:hypothetical protein [Psychroserpens damuponensis]|uniref:hypothetical protein n=1 Tax=Psychroserpens damuponensis TaxID=943936 RepID=UPI00058CD5E4|nr:hypothetical protein [Psychroserpens damuponensis]
MKYTYSIVILFLFVVSATAQPKLKKSIDDLNLYLSVYDSLRSHGEHYYTPKLLKVTREDMLKEFGESFEPIDSIETFESIGIIQSKIDELLRQTLTNKKASTLELETLFHENLSVVLSKDKKLINFSIDAKSGGSYQSRISWIYYLNNDVFKEYPVHDKWDLRDQESPTIFEANGYYDIKTITSSKTTYYLLLGSVKTCGSCYVDYVTLVHFEKDDFDLDFEFAIDSRDYDEKIVFDETSKTLSVSYVTDDLSEDCFCSNEEYQTYWTDGLTNDELFNDDETLKQQSCRCLFKFNGKTFELTKRSAEFIKTND